MSSWGLKYYPLCGFDCRQVLNKRHVRKHGFGKADSFGFKEQGTKDPRTRGGYLSSPSCPFSLSLFFLCDLFVTFFGTFFFMGGGGGQGLVFIPGAFANSFGPPSSGCIL